MLFPGDRLEIACVLPSDWSVIRGGPAIGRDAMATRRVMKLSDEFLQPVTEALQPTALGRPKTQAVITRFLDKFEELLLFGYTFRDIAIALNKAGACGRRGRPFTEQSLYNFIKRAKQRSLQSTVTSEVADEPERHSLKRTTKSSRTEVSAARASTPPALGAFKVAIEEASSRAATDRALFRRRDSRG